MEYKEHKKAIHFIVLYVLFIGLFVWLLTLSGQEADTENWACVQQQCVATEPAGEQWIAQNCGTTTTDTGEQVEACRVVVNGVQQIVRRDALNMSAIQVCTQSVCLQEVRVRNVNRTIEPTQ